MPRPRDQQPCEAAATPAQQPTQCDSKADTRPGATRAFLLHVGRRDAGQFLCVGRGIAREYGGGGLRLVVYGPLEKVAWWLFCGPSTRDVRFGRW
ncbi:hypothetical protein HAX54_000536 [Datura stramonium]|uniref:Uncharacterized protein n=1 Tax=Datura stramonium TaxID=4076 RepID=A0ABS8WSQ3_DATST|nr:hypothetical protein [Datura stramonium]